MTPGNLARLEVGGRLIGQQADRRLEERRVDGASAAGVQRGEDAKRGPQPRALVDDRRADPHAGTARLAGDADQAAERLDERVIARPVLQRSRAAESPDVAIDEPGIPVA